VLAGASGQIVNCQFQNIPPGAAVLSEGTGATSFAGSTFENGPGAAIDIQVPSSTDTSLVDCRIAGMAGPGVIVRGGGGIVIRGTLIRDCEAGIRFAGPARGEVDHCTIVNCDGAGIEARDDSGKGSGATVHSAILWNNGEAVSVDPLSTLDLTWSDAGPGDGSVYPGTRNINRPPLFVDPAAGDYHLAPGSPCIRTGAAFTDMGAFPHDGPLGLTGWVLK
jgi:hypothetical protein